jgi:tetratricopeptide (TPR) repeat protein
MKKKPIYERIKERTEKGQLKKAIDTCHSILKREPENLEIREALGELYNKMQNPEQAGRYWFLIKNKTNEQEKAVDFFTSSLNNDPKQILLNIKYQADIYSIQDEFAKNKLMQLVDETIAKYHESFNYKKINNKYKLNFQYHKNHPVHDYEKSKDSFWDNLKINFMVFLGFGILVLVIAALFLGFEELFRRVIHWFDQ